MSESMRSHDEPAQGPFLEADPTNETLDSPDTVRIVVGQFLTQCRHSAIAEKEPLAEFILAALNEVPSDDWSKELQGYQLDTDDEQFKRLLEEDTVFFTIYDLALRLKTIVGRGEAMSKERKALIALMDLRAGETLLGEEPSIDSNDDSWQVVIAKLFPDLT